MDLDTSHDSASGYLLASSIPPAPNEDKTSLSAMDAFTNLFPEFPSQGPHPQLHLSLATDSFTTQQLSFTVNIGGSNVLANRHTSVPAKGESVQHSAIIHSLTLISLSEIQ